MVGLVRDEAAEVASCHTIPRQQRFRNLGHLPYSKLVHGLAILVDKVQACIHGFMACRKRAASRWHVQGICSRAVHLMKEINEADFALDARLQQDRSRAIAEEDARGAIGVVDDGSHHVRTDDENFLVGTGFHQLRANL